MLRLPYAVAYRAFGAFFRGNAKIGGGDVRVSAREHTACSVASPRLRQAEAAFPTLTRGVRNVARLRRLKPSFIFAVGKKIKTAPLFFPFYALPVKKPLKNFYYFQ